MRFYCVEWNFNFNSEGMAVVLDRLGLTVIERDFNNRRYIGFGRLKYA